MQPDSTPTTSLELSLVVVTGPDEGMERRFRQQRVTIGRERSNDFVLSDGFVSNRHAELTIVDGAVIFRDLCSRHGSMVVVDSFRQKLQDTDKVSEVTVVDGTEMQLGSSLIRLEVIEAVEEVEEPEEEEEYPRTQRQQAVDLEPPAPVLEVAGSSSLITTAHHPVQTLNRRLESADARMAVLFRLAGQLNALTSLDEVLDLIVETTFDSFPAANFFAVTLGADADEVSTCDPFLTRVRGAIPLPDGEDSPILSSSIMRRVASSRESVLFTKDSLGADVSQSILDAKITACMCAPLVGQKSLLGIMQVDTRGRGSLFTRQDLELFNILASNAAFAIERARLTDSIVEMFEGFVGASVNAIEARDPVTAGHSERVAHYTLSLAEAINEIEVGELRDIHLNPDELRELRYAALLHDFGKIAVREDVLQKGARLPTEQINLIRQRFQTARELTYRRWLHDYAKRLEQKEISPTGQGLAKIDQHYLALSRQLDETLEWLVEVSTKGYLSDEDIERIKALGKKTFPGADGSPHRYLTPMEVENLCIRKGTLNDEEWVEMRSHAALRESYLDQIPWSDELKSIPCIAGAHHEKLDGSGYPDGLAGDAIIPQVRMLTISDIFDALTASDRPYRKAATIDRALEILTLESNDQKLDHRLVDVFGTVVIPRIKSTIPNPRDD